MVIETFQKIQRGIFSTPDSGGNVTEHLRRKVIERFGLNDVPDGFLYFPIELGGLGLRNPLIPLLLVRDNAFENPMERIDRAFEEEVNHYNQAKKAYDEGNIKSTTAQILKHDEPFMSFDEYTRYREETSDPLWYAYSALLEAPTERTIRTTPDVSSARESASLSVQNGTKWQSEAYDEWLMQLYGSDIIKRFGGLALGEKRLLSIGLASMLRSEKVRWQG
ncbi:hypothetical protein MMC28_006082 [Mycoblastus sanguinarius]|nr:hypothetical protein [Mycoblastus sanguinarius]